MSEVLVKKDWEKVCSIIQFIDKHGGITPNEAKQLTKKSAATVRRYFKMLTDTGYIIAEGNTNNIVYCRSEL